MCNGFVSQAISACDNTYDNSYVQEYVGIYAVLQELCIIMRMQHHIRNHTR